MRHRPSALALRLLFLAFPSTPLSGQTKGTAAPVYEPLRRYSWRATSCQV